MANDVKPYDAVITGNKFLKKTSTKLYLLEFEGRGEARTWAGTGIRENDVAKGVESLLITNDKMLDLTPKVAAFLPHVGRIWVRGNPYLPQQETELQPGGLWYTQSVANGIPRKVDTTCLGCSAEIIIAGIEEKMWLDYSVEEYFQKFIPVGTRFRDKNKGKLAEHLGLI